jgi:succinate dehydrogenase / fumarate reductase cytochrome b subunit
MANLASGDGAPRQRPLSPHLSIYRLTLTMAMSIAHRATGIALYAGAVLLAVWLLALSSDAAAYMHVAHFLRSFIGRVILFGYTWALLHHMLGGIRHFIWDAGYGLDHPQREWLAEANLIGSIALTILVWLLVALV